MKEVTIDQIQMDAQITNSDIPLVNKVSSEDEVVSLIDKTKPGDYVSVTNRNNLAETFIYKRNDVNRMANFVKWDGHHRDITWYNDDETEFYLYTPEQLVGLDLLVSSGKTFRGKYVFLGCDIDLNYHSWHPIGAYDIQTEYDMFKSKGSFQGTFDGLNHTIFGLRNNNMLPQYTFAFFMDVCGATIKNIIFDHVMIESIGIDMTAAVVAVTAVNSTFSNIVMHGKMVAANLASVCYYGINTVFYSCKNTTEMISNSSSTDTVVCGGICGALEITREILNECDIETAKIFSYCTNSGTIVVKGKNITTFYAGHLFGNFLSDDKDFSMIIEKCSISKKSIIDYRGDKTANCVFFGSLKENENQSNQVVSDSKKDLLSGIIGRVSIKANITVIKITESVIVNNMVLPGTINTLQSKSGESSFYTISAENIHTEDCIYNLEPYFSFIKSVRY